MPDRSSTTHLLIQIDGLSRPALEKAMEAGRAPRLRALLDEDGHRLVDLYPGLPSTTPAAQGELFIGIRTAVPGFAFRDRASGEVRHMLDPATAAAVEDELLAEEHGPLLLENGSAYCDIYTAGAARSRFCPSGMARTRQALRRGILHQLRAVVSYAGVLLRGGILLAGEFWRKLRRDGAGGAKDLATRANDTWHRLIAVVGLRDASRLAALHDIKDGLRVVHVNFVGYDKQAHHYGPLHDAAIRTMGGIDAAIGALVDAARDRNGDVTIVVHSDHGQESTTPLSERQDALIEQIVREAATEADVPEEGGDASDDDFAARLRERLGETILGIGASRDAENRSLLTVESGPIAHVYCRPAEDDADMRARFAKAIARRAEPVLAAWRDAEGTAHAAIGDRVLDGVQAIADALVEEHPYRDEIEADLPALLGHRDAGEIVLLGTGFDEDPVTFADEHGSHGGPGPVECAAFAILPPRLADPAGHHGAFRLEDLRRALLDGAGARDGG